MRKLLLIASMAAMAAAMPALAKPGGGHGGGHAAGHGNPHGTVSGGHARTDSRANVRARTRTGASVVRTRTDASSGGRYGAHDCPPGLAAKGNGCLPPGQARKLFSVARESRRAMITTRPTARSPCPIGINTGSHPTPGTSTATSRSTWSTPGRAW